MRTEYSDMSFTGGSGITKAVKVLLIIQICIFVLAKLTPRIIIPLFALTPALTIGHLMLWQVLTYAFLHVGLFHLLFNMYMLWAFGVTLEQMWGTNKFTSFLLFISIGGGICSLAVGLFVPGIVIGASGVIFGIIVAQTMINPEGVILFFFLFPMKMKHAAWAFVAITVLVMVSSIESSAAAMAQLGGGLFGYLYFRSEHIRIFLDRVHPAALMEKWRRTQEERRAGAKLRLDEEVDRILDKISRQGIHTLTPRERKMLEKKSRKS
jgi:membrane associated rhomboid family serine protease